MPTKRKRKRRGVSSRRKRARRARGRSGPRPRASRPLKNTPSSDEDFVPESVGEEISSDYSTEQEDGEQGEGASEDEEETSEDFSADDSSDEDFDAEAERSNRSANLLSRPGRELGRETGLNEDFDKNVQSLEDNGIRREGQLANRTSRRRRRARQNSSDEDFDMDMQKALEDDGIGEHGNRASHPAKVRRRHCRQDSSDEDFEVVMDRVLENCGDDNEGATRPMTRAMDFCQVSDTLVGRSGSTFSDSIRHQVGENADAPQKVTVRDVVAGESSLPTSNPRGSSAVKHAEIGIRKGKGKVLEGDESAGTSLFNAQARNVGEEAAAVVCGICLTEMVITERGKLDCCDHHFCFGCIMEWAKVESRCPMCKQRFITIAKSGNGISKRTRTIRIPLRDQVYIPPEDQDLPPEDPYGDVVCMECHGTGDEGLLLLCDRCDTAAHTFCVGLGRSVPRGDWYCRDCQAFIGGNSGSEDEAEDMVSAEEEEEEEEDGDGDDDEYDNDYTESLLRSIVASADSRNHRTRQTRVQRRPTPTPTSSGSSRSVRNRLWQRLSRRQRRRSIAAPRLSQAARALLVSSSSEPNQLPHASSEAPQGVLARTVPRQRRLHERINEMRNNWGRIQNGDLQFNALRRGATGANQLADSSNSSGAPIPSTPSPSIRLDVNDKREVGSVEQPESSAQKNEDLQRAWRMLDHAQGLSARTDSSKPSWQKLGAGASSSTLRQGAEPSATATNRSMNITSSNAPSPLLENGDNGTYKPESLPLQVSSNLKHDELLLGQVTRLVVRSVPTTLPQEWREEELPCSSNPKQLSAVATPPIPTGGKHNVRSLENVSNGKKKTVSTQGFKPELVKASKHFERTDAGMTQTFTENTATKGHEDVHTASSSSSLPHEGLKVHLIELVKKQTWPVYISERLDKEQFKRIARAAVHSLLALCDPNNKSMSLSCAHLEDQGHNPVTKCCNKCLDQHVEKAVKSAKDKIVRS